MFTIECFRPAIDKWFRGTPIGGPLRLTPIRELLSNVLLYLFQVGILVIALPQLRKCRPLLCAPISEVAILT